MIIEYSDNDEIFWDVGIIAKALSVDMPRFGLFSTRYGNAQIQLPDGGCVYPFLGDAP